MDYKVNKWTDGILRGLKPSAHNTFNFTQTITPKFGCEGKGKDKAVKPRAYVFSVPAITFDITFILYKDFNFSSLDSFNKGNDIDDEMESVKVEYADANDITFKKCYVETYSPQLGNSGSINMFSLSGMVYGTIT